MMVNRNLEVIGGRTVTEYFASLYIVKTSLTSLGLRSLKKIHSGSVAILENKRLCYAQTIDWESIKKSPEHPKLLQNNKNESLCSEYYLFFFRHGVRPTDSLFTVYDCCTVLQLRKTKCAIRSAPNRVAGARDRISVCLAETSNTTTNVCRTAITCPGK